MSFLHGEEYRCIPEFIVLANRTNDISMIDQGLSDSEVPLAGSCMESGMTFSISTINICSFTEEKINNISMPSLHSYE
jgi:hypothetical protein